MQIGIECMEGVDGVQRPGQEAQGSVYRGEGAFYRPPWCLCCLMVAQALVPSSLKTGELEKKSKKCQETKINQTNLY